MMIKLTSLLTGCLMAFSLAATAQDTKQVLVTMPESPAAVAVAVAEPGAETDKKTEPAVYKAPALPRMNYSLEMGAMVASGRYGYSATYLKPTAYYNISNRFRAFTSLTYLNMNSLGTFQEGSSRQPFGSQHYVLEAGGQYLYSSNLTLTGSVWKDFSKTAMPNSPYYGSGRQGMSFRADYKINDRMTITGGFRYSNGSPSDFHHNQFSQPYSPIGF